MSAKLKAFRSYLVFIVCILRNTKSVHAFKWMALIRAPHFSLSPSSFPDVCFSVKIPQPKKFKYFFFQSSSLFEIRFSEGVNAAIKNGNTESEQMKFPTNYTTYAFVKSTKIACVCRIYKQKKCLPFIGISYSRCCVSISYPGILCITEFNHAMAISSHSNLTNKISTVCGKGSHSLFAPSNQTSARHIKYKTIEQHQTSKCQQSKQWGKKAHTGFWHQIEMRAMGIKYKTSLLSYLCSVSIWAGCLLSYSTIHHTIRARIPWVNIFSLDYVTDYHKFRFCCCCCFFSTSWILFDKLSVGIYT